MTRLATAEYTDTDKIQLAKAKQLAQIQSVHAEDMFDRVARAALVSQSEETESPLPYQPCRRLVRVADILEESSLSETPSVLGGYDSESPDTHAPSQCEERARGNETTNVHASVLHPCTQESRRVRIPDLGRSVHNPGRNSIHA